MKKVFLIIAFLLLVFLGLGNYSFVVAGPLCTSTPSTVPGNSYTCEYSTPPAKCNGNGQACIGPKDCGGETTCCICNAAPVPPPVTPPVTPSPNTTCISGTLTDFGRCDCGSGKKLVGNTCTSCQVEGVCCGIQLNTNVPFIGKCIENNSANVGPDEEPSVNGQTAFPVLMGSLTKILVTLILIVSFVLIIIGGIMIATGNPSGGKKMIINVAIGIALLGASGVILRLINPNFFG